MSIFDQRNETNQLVCRAKLDVQEEPCEIIFSRLGIVYYLVVDRYRPVNEYLSDKIVDLAYDDISDGYLCEVIADVLDIGFIMFEVLGPIGKVESDIWELLIQSDNNVNSENCFITKTSGWTYVAFVKNKELAKKINIMKTLS